MGQGSARVGLGMLSVCVLLAVAPAMAAADATITVGQNGCSLPDALAAAQSGTATGGCPAGDTAGLNTIVLPAGAYQHWGLTVASGRIRIVGHAASDTRIEGQLKGRILTVAPGASLELRRLTLKDGIAPAGAMAGHLGGTTGQTGGPGFPGGAVYSQGTLRIADSIVLSNGAGEGGSGETDLSLTFGGKGGKGGAGGGVASTGELTIDRTLFNDNGSGQGGSGGNAGGASSSGGYGGDGGNGGALAVLGGHATVTRSTFFKNGTFTGGNPGGGNSFNGEGGAGGDGGAIHVAAGAALLLRSSTVDQNVTAAGNTGGTFGGDGGNGSGIHVQGDAEIRGTTISGNSAGGGSVYGAGGVAVERDPALPPARILNSTIAGNLTLGGSWAGIAVLSGRLALTSSTVAFSGVSGTPQNPSGIYVEGEGDAITMRNSLVADNGSKNCANFGGTITSLGHNLSFPDETCPHEVKGDPKIAPLADNGGPTQTVALRRGSAALDRGVAAGLRADQRGRPRPYDLGALPNLGDGSDVGAFELQGPVFGDKPRVKLRLAAEHVRPSKPFGVVVSNANVFPVTGTVGARTPGKKHVVRLASLRVVVRPGGRKTAKLALPHSLRVRLTDRGSLDLVLRARVLDPARHVRVVRKTVTLKLAGG